MQQLTSYLSGAWVYGQGQSREIQHAVTGEPLYQVCSDGLPLAASLSYARKLGGTALAKMTFQQRAQMMKAVAKHLLANKEALYQISYQTGATRNDSWVDIEGGIATLFSYAGLAGRELPDDSLWPEDELIPLSKQSQFAARHVLTSRPGVALHINAFNFPCWGMLEKLAPTWLAGMPAIIKPATASAQLTQAMVKLIIDSGLVPEGALQLICGGVGDMFDHLDYQDAVTFTGSAQTGQKLRSHPRLLEKSIAFTMEADSLNCCVLGEDVTPEMPEFALFIKEVSREMTSKAGQKCTAIRRIIVPAARIAEVQQALLQRLAGVKIGDPQLEQVRMGALVNQEQRDDVQQKVEFLLRNGCEPLCGATLDKLEVVGDGAQSGAFYPITLLYCADPFRHQAVHGTEAFGPVATLMPYQTTEQAIELALLGQGSLAGSLVTADAELASQFIRATACAHGRMLVLDRHAATESTGHGSPLPLLVHGGPGRAGGGEELGGLRAVKHYMQRTAIQGSPSMLAAISREWVRGADVVEEQVHPFRKYFEQLQIGESLLTARRTITEADLVNFACLSGDHFYAHMDKIGAAESLFGERVAHGYFVVSAAAGLFVDPGVGPVIANYGMENLRFIEPVKIGDTIQVRLTCKKKIRKPQKTAEDRPHGVVVWDVQVLNQHQQAVALYSILTLVARQEGDFNTVH
ncbi:phenylacetic acid degradation bifunctional protein PaaZ [Serratia fonticola]|jgi:oxepin-CoA hydrolase/3-oxo-5,6-dehydrosuberyl-CoA semialdehyde dehydrogenase|uniref:phenylacetic acid degradation bifunctional protein PaaZ n=1 Tax=Serratia fonticola TaxID=47917 RepID=UPI000FB5B468|nr:phenylacetic acid degradation bifunctional protein PaaZ [Serratia fonticola]NTY88637.1 phenylacetic acid degradation bifunctional protein PaaZ [Serratia fonticola]NTZ14199.1 phenylacetic acid degradation bifunctional protein PaaZ [Serratia fonticola]CAI1538600.1 3,4-dehydroadipyl-CoA semialdehyde dehydrogenase [Serratia fonticola]CAI2480173.1 3,4-dehydroadipyl-CoA semialdehyde dehydrogenase [Serratia fonticola]HBE9179662.1 phenylacetic acid degradation bifunctional protein PaaZ [Serratia fo